MNYNEEKAYEQGSRFAWTRMLQECLRQLGFEDEARDKSWIVERETAVNMLRGLCAEYGDNDWPENLSLADVIEKHLMRHLYARIDGQRPR